MKGLDELRCEMSKFREGASLLRAGAGGWGEVSLGGAALWSLASYNHVIAVPIFGIGKLADPIL